MSKDELAQLGAEFHQWKARAEKAEAELKHINKVCAEMREALIWAHSGSLCVDPATAKRRKGDCPICDALSTATGTRYYSEAEVRPLVEALEKLHGFSPRDIDEMSLHSYVNTVAGDALEHARSLGIGKETK